MRKLFSSLFISSASFLITSCGNTSAVVNEQQQEQVNYLGDVRPEESAVLWQQTAAEYDALCYQAFNSAKSYLKNELKYSDDNHPAIIMDLDETVLDNSKYNGFLITEKASYTPESWEQWVEKTEAGLVPGAKDFIDFVRGQGIEVFFISNRSKEHLDPTIKNLESLGIVADAGKMLLKESTSVKTERRNIVLASYDVVMLLGDNLADFDDLFEGESTVSNRKLSVKGNEALFGRKFIILPNVMYGGWEKALKMDDPETMTQPKQKGFRKYLRSFTP